MVCKLRGSFYSGVVDLNRTAAPLHLRMSFARGLPRATLFAAIERPLRILTFRGLLYVKVLLPFYYICITILFTIT
jgi:hypothetical protein